MNIIVPLTITAAMLGAGTSLAEDPTAAWVSGTYAVGDERHVVSTHRVYRCAVAGSRTISPELDPTNWVDMRPTNKWAPFDIYTSTAATGTTSITYVLSPGYFNALALYGLTGSQYAITLKDAPGGATLYSASGYLLDDPLGWYEYLFNPPKYKTRLVFSGLPIRPTAELTITVSAATGAAVGLGMIVVGDYRALIGDAAWGGTEYGAKAEPVTYSYIKTADDGSTSIVRRHKATNLKVSVVMPQAAADAALASVQEVLDVPVAWIATDTAGYQGLNVFGIGSGSLSYDSYGHATFDLSVKGLI